MHVHGKEEERKVGVEAGIIGDFDVVLHPVGEGSGGKHEDHEPRQTRCKTRDNNHRCSQRTCWFRPRQEQRWFCCSGHGRPAL